MNHSGIHWILQSKTENEDEWTKRIEIDIPLNSAATSLAVYYARLVTAELSGMLVTMMS